MRPSAWTLSDARTGWIPIRLAREFRTNRKRLREHQDAGYSLCAGGSRGWGEAYTMEGEAAAAELAALCTEGRDAWDLDGLLAPLGNLAARSSVDLAVHDAVTRSLGLPLFRFLGLPPPRSVTSVSLSLGSVEDVCAEARDWIEEGYTSLKLKMGSDSDPSLPSRLRKAVGPDAAIRVDGNQAWDVRGFREVLPALKDAAVEFCEQPFPVGESELCAEVRDGGVPIILDEEITGPGDVARVAKHGGVDGVNVKLSKCGGIRRSLETIRVARAHGLRVMIGCFFETSLAVSAAVHLTGLADYVDLDAPLFLQSDPFSGLQYEGGGPRLAGVGIGVTPGQEPF